ncbi:hypothetical protein HIM_04544 [Hirsutella minnesotensis 3608]|uniref:Uncharacterized protein n=1 Tax=Hirsutella minnesotensis 3608 TaxID=1043627 RepID=A0A0F7ZV68_9HYPO|nr:hypothetical protein HIM_04544 [Hirsutella minnesotensis 3608]
MSASGYNDADKIAAALELAKSFKSGKKKGYEGPSRAPIVKHAKRDASKPHCPLPSKRKYEGLGAFGPSNQAQSRNPIIGAAGLDFLTRRDAVAETGASSIVEPAVTTQDQVDGIEGPQTPKMVVEAVHVTPEQLKGTASLSTAKTVVNMSPTGNPFTFEKERPENIPPVSILENFFTLLAEVDKSNEKLEDVNECLIDFKIQDNVPQEPCDQESSLQAAWGSLDQGYEETRPITPQKPQVIKFQISDVERLQWDKQIRRKPVASSSSMKSPSPAKVELAEDIVGKESQLLDSPSTSEVVLLPEPEAVAVLAKETPQADVVEPVRPGTNQGLLALAMTNGTEKIELQPQTNVDEKIPEQKSKLSAHASSFIPEQDHIQGDMIQALPASPITPNPVYQGTELSCAYNDQVQTPVAPSTGGIVSVAGTTPFTMQQPVQGQPSQVQAPPQMASMAPILGPLQPSILLSKPPKPARRGPPGGLQTSRWAQAGR